MMNMNRKWITLILLLLGAMTVSGCGINKEVMRSYNEAKELFQKATAAGAKKCAPVQYATAEAALAHADHEIAEGDDAPCHLTSAIAIVKEKSLEALKLTPCEKPAPPPPAPPPPPKPVPPPAPAPPPPPPTPQPAPKPVVLDTIYFDPNKTNITPTAAKALDRNGMTLKENPNIKIEIGGHTDESRTEKANQKLSEKRALSAQKYLQDKFNIPDSRLVTKGYGSTKPVADNKTQEGRSKNRRVEFKVIP
jgi:outer membrane protein OmpA-like peptidoglycan-associated protein